MPKDKGNQSAKMIKYLQAKLGLTQEQVAVKVSVMWSAVNRWENGRSKL